MQILFFNEGNLGSQVMGQGQLDEALRTGLERRLDVQARFAGLATMGRAWKALATHPVPVLGRRELDLRTLRWHAAQSLRATAAIERELRHEPADALFVHSHSVAFAMAARMRRTPTFLSVDATVEDWAQMPAWRSERPTEHASMAPSRALERRALKRAELVFAWTAWSRRGVERASPSARVTELHPGIDLERYRPARRSPRERPRLLFVGGRFAEKGGPELIAALGERLGAQVELDVVTPAEVDPRPGLRVHRLGASDPQLLELLQQADLFCLPTRGDAVPWAVLEAMACGTPVLATKIGGIPDLLDDGEAGVLVDQGQERQLGEALSRLLADGALRTRLAARARERCEQLYDARRQVPLLLDRIVAGERADAPQ